MIAYHFEEKFASIKLSLIEIPESILGSLFGPEFHYSIEISLQNSKKLAC